MNNPSKWWPGKDRINVDKYQLGVNTGKGETGEGAEEYDEE